ncbi:MAG: hypothetical protein H6621_01550 [Halobacteriovoraceae bacterium]|nr:hypothetical protein [Halobacteriovoraceae bacterium]
MDIEENYLQIIEGLKRGGRPLKRFSGDQVEVLKNKLQAPPSQQDLKQVICLLCYSTKPLPQLEPLLLDHLKQAEQYNDQIVISLLDCARKHIIMGNFLKGKRLNFSFLKELENLLNTKNSEVLFWLLETIHQCGPQKSYLFKKLREIKPPLLQRLLVSNKRKIARSIEHILES